MIELLSTKDLADIKDYITNNVETPSASIEYILRFWDKEKENLKQGFQNSLILEREVEFKNRIEDLEKYLLEKSWINYIKDLIIKGIDSYVDNEEDRIAIKDLLTPESLITNKNETVDKKIKLENGAVFQIKKHCKVMKTLQKLNLIYNFVEDDYFEKFKNLVSEVTNLLTLKGVMCLSIHPIDFMTMSDNNYSWSSCMSWEQDGSYKQGTVEMMNSPMVIVGYLKAKNGTYMDKKWRELYIVDTENKFACNVKAYPYRNDNMSKYNVQWIQDLFFPNNTIQNAKTSWSISVYCYTNYMYNDFDNNYVLYVSTNGVKEKYSFNYSGVSECMICGDTNVEREDSLTCYHCGTNIYCYHCDDPISENEAIYHEGVYYCEYCYNRIFATCSYSGEICRHNEAYYIRVIHNNDLLTNFFVKEEYVHDFCKKYVYDIKQIKKTYFGLDININNFKLDDFLNNRKD